MAISVSRLNVLNTQVLLNYRYLFTTITSRSTSYFLFSFWLFFFFFGESLLLLTFNFSALSDVISSSSFFTIKQHTVFYLNSISVSLLSSISNYIVFLTTASVVYLINLNYSYSYRYFSQVGFSNSMPYIVIIMSTLL